MLVPAVLAFATLAAGAYSDAAGKPSPYGAIKQYDTGTYGPELKLEHLFYNQWPTGVAVTSDGTLYANFPSQLDTANTQFTVAVLTNLTSEAPFPSLAYNTPPGGRADASRAGYGAATPEHFVSVQSVVVDALDRVWCLDTGRPSNNGTQLLAQYGGPKLVGFYQNGTRFANIVLPTNVAYPDTFLNDVRIDVRSTLTASGGGVAYITDSSFEARTGIIVIDLGSGRSWRHLTQSYSTLADTLFTGYYNGVPSVPINPAGVRNHLWVGTDGIALSHDGIYIYFTPLSSRRFYRITTASLLVEPSAAHPSAADNALQAVQFLGDLGSHADGLESDSTGAIYATAPEHNSLTVFRPETGLMELFVRDPRLQWPDTAAIGWDKRLYVTSNQWWLQASNNGGIDRRQPPYQVWSVPVPGGKVNPA